MGDILANNSYIVGELAGISTMGDVPLIEIELVTRKKILVSNELLDEIESFIGEKIAILREDNNWFAGARK